MTGLDTVAEAVVEALAGPCAVVEGTPIVAACSGGADSVALVAALGRASQRWPLRAVVFVDHGLRDVGDERASARRAAGRAGVSFVAAAVDLPATGNLQAAARGARYATLMAHAGGDALVATGHTLDDQAETVLQRLLRGAGIRGLAAIPWRDGRLVRPLLAVRRAQTRASGLPFCDDPSNATEAYQRNRLRHEVLPRLEAENPRAAWALAKVAEQARAELELVDALSEAVDLAAADLSAATPELAEVLVRWRHRREVGGAPPRRGAASQLAHQLVSGARNAKTSLGGGVSGRARAGRLAFEDERDPRLEVVAHGTGHYRLGTLRLELSLTSAPTGREVDPQDRQDTRLVAMFPIAGLRWPLRIRKSSAASRTNPARRVVQVDEPGRPSTTTSQRGAPSTEYVITDAVGALFWPPAAGTAPAAEQRPLLVIMATRGG